MNEPLTIFTTVTPSYSSSSELRLSLEMLQRAFPQATWITHTADTSLSIKELIAQNLPATGYVLFIKEPAMLVSERMYPILKKHLADDPGILVAMPVDPPHASTLLARNYHTLRGFERFSHKLSLQDKAPIQYDGRKTWVFLISAQSLSTFDLPDDPFQLLDQLPAEQVAIIPQAYAHPFYNYYNETRSDILPFVPQNIQSLLDIGCSRGGFAATVKQTLHCRATGIEINCNEAAIAMEKLDAVWVGDVLSMSITERFDCISCLDVLEHIPEPEALLLKIKQWLTPDGSILLAVPNVGFWAIAEDLLAGRWDYVPTGIMCNTHLRFYTQHSLQALLEACGLTPVSWKKRYIPIPEQLETAFKHYQSTGFDIDYENLSTNTFIVLAKPEK